MKFKLIFLTLACLVLCGCGPNIAKEAQPLVTRIIKEQLGGSVECVKVKLGEKFADNHWKGKAVLSNGNELNITIELKKETNEIYVLILEQ